MKKIIIPAIIGLFILSSLLIAQAENIQAVKGQVIDTYWKPVYKVKVLIDGKIAGETDKGGNFCIEEVSPGKHTLTFSREGWKFPEQSIFVKDAPVNDVSIQGSLTDWARFLLTYLFAVILMLIIIADFLVFVDYYVMIKPTKIISALGITTGIFAIIMAIAKVGTYEAILFILATVLSISIIIHKGQKRVAIALEEKAQKEEKIQIEAKKEEDKFKNLIGLEGAASSNLSLYGKVEIDKKIYEAKSRTDFIKRGQKICVLDVQGGTLLVEKGAYNKYA